MRKILDVPAWAAEMEENALRRQRARAQAGAPAPANPAPQLPAWAEIVRGVPNGVLRSALFGAIRRGPRRYLKSEPVAALDGIEILYTGERLDQGDLDVWETVLHIARRQEMGRECHFTAYAMLKMLGKTDTGSNRATLNERLMRLKANGLEVTQGRFGYVGSLIDEVYKDRDSGEYVIVLNAKLRPLFGNDQFTQIDWNVRHALSGKPLAQWLHGFYASHAEPFAIRVTTLLTLSGSENGDAHSAGQALKRALDALAEASQAHGQSFNYTIKNELVSIDKTTKKRRAPIPSRHIGKLPS